mmetsp:Transcript_121451/g.259315  ORF Transcript_121451/g.259315 Transcript_121451/m.259315 type:complete len:193 (-) Transcript_121451:23-601(-)
MVFGCCCVQVEASATPVEAAVEDCEPRSDMAFVLQDSATPHFFTTSSLEGSSSPRDSPRSKEMKKARLQQLVREFSRNAMGGIPVTLVDPDSAELSKATLAMDKYLYALTLSSIRGDVLQLNMKDMSAIYKGPDFMQKMPNIAHLSNVCVGMDFLLGAQEKKLCFHFQDPLQCDHFYTCLKILRMSVDINST